jgi:hypothetical protein
MITSSKSHSLRGSKTPREVHQSQTIDVITPFLSSSKLPSIPSSRPGRRFRETSSDPHPSRSFGDSVTHKDAESIRFFFQNVKGISYSSSNEDYRYFLSCIKLLEVVLQDSWKQTHAGVMPIFPQTFGQLPESNINKPKLFLAPQARKLIPCLSMNHSSPEATLLLLLAG